MMPSSNAINLEQIEKVLTRVSSALNDQQKYLTELDQAVGDGDLGITASKIAATLSQYTIDTPGSNDLGKYFISAGMAVNRAASSTMGTLLATALMRAGKEIRGKSNLEAQDLVTMIKAADQGIQERGKARLGDKTIVDALHPAAEAFQNAIESGMGLTASGEKMLEAAQAGLQAVTPRKSRIGRASWVGERTKGQVDPGCALLVTILKAVLGA
jgi:dihydroxyacetone kinase